MKTFIPRTLSRRLEQVHVNHRRVAASAMTVAIFVALAKLVIAARELAIAWRYGISGVVDAYQLAFTITTWLPLVMTSIGASVLVPTLIALRKEPEERKRFLAELNVAAVGLAVTVMLLVLVTGPHIADWMASELAVATRQIARTMVRQLAPLVLITTLAGYLAARLQASERFAYSLLEAAPSAGIVIFVLLAPAEWGAAPLVWGVLAGGVVQLVWLTAMTHHANGSLGGISLSLRSPRWGSLYQAFAIMAAGQIILTLSQPIDQIFAARLEDGAVATLGYANRLIALVTGLGSIVLTRALLPVLSGIAAEGQLELGREQTLRWAGVMFSVGTAAAALGWFMAPGAVSLLFERGAFSARDSEAVALVLRYGLLQLPFYFGGMVLVQWFAALRRYEVLLIAAIFAMIAKLILNIMLTPFLGLAGIMVATSVMYAATSVLQLFYMKKVQ